MMPHAYGVTRIYSPADGATMGLQGMIDDMIGKADSNLAAQVPHSLVGLTEQQRDQNDCTAHKRRRGLVAQLLIDAKCFASFRRNVCHDTGLGSPNERMVRPELRDRLQSVLGGLIPIKPAE